MVRYQLKQILSQHGYQPLEQENSGIMVREDEQAVYAVTIIPFRTGVQIQNYHHLQNRVNFTLANKYQKPVEILHILITPDGMFEDDVSLLVEQFPNLWLVAADTGRLYVYENQQADFDGLYACLGNLQPVRVKRWEQLPFTVTPVNIVLVVLNILAFLAVVILNHSYLAVYDTDIMLKMGAMSVATVKEGAWYQLFTSMFLHFGLNHLFSNMVLLTYAGCELEKRIGKVAYLAIYMLSGIIGNIVSLFYYAQENDEIVSAGASGAIFGIVGALFIVLIVKREQGEDLTPQRLLLLTVFTIYSGMTSVGIDNAAHIGGLFTGIIGGFLLSKISYYGKLE
ncbi:MAG: rhomboid family intramembrane serine protease [Clostridium sp.]|nr:rhomboid family intramembrane serine protease [Clostridium sp.]